MKRILSFLLVLVMLLSVMGCQSNTPASSDASGAASGSGDSSAPASDKPELQLWALPLGPAETYGPAIQKVLDKYNSEDHSATVKLEVLSWSGFIEQFQTAIAAGTPPDITFATYYDVAKYVAADEAIDLTDIVTKWEEEKNPILDDFLPGTLELGKFGDSYYALPFSTEGKTIYYRASILEDELGFTDLDKEVTWDKLLEICAAVKEKYGEEGMYALGFFTLDMGSTNAMLNLLVSNAASWVNAEGTGPAYDDPKVMEVMEFVGKMYENGYFPDGMVSYNQYDLEKLYDSGKLAMVWKSNFSHAKANEEIYNDTKLMGPIVGPSADKARGNMWMNGAMGFKNAGHEEEVKEFLAWLIDGELLPILTEGGASMIPLCNSLYEDEFYKTDWMQSQYAKFKDYYVDLSWPAAAPPVATGPIFNQNLLGMPLEALLMGSTDYAGDLNKAQEAMAVVFKEYE